MAIVKIAMPFPVSILRKSISGRHRPVRVADGPMTARCRFTLNASWVHHSLDFIFKSFGSPLLNIENILEALMKPKWPKAS